MDILGFIQRQKEHHFTYRDADKLALQKASLERERKELEARAKLQNEVRKEQQAIKDIKREPVRRGLSGIRQGFQGLQKAAERSNKAVSAFSNPDVKSPFSSGSNPFGPDKKKFDEKKAERPRQIVININGNDEKKKVE